MSFTVRNWPEYEARLRRRGSLTLWIEDAALDSWQTLGPGSNQARYENAAIQTTLTVRTAFKVAPDLCRARVGAAEFPVARIESIRGGLGYPRMQSQGVTRDTYRIYS